jgi:hypothetical protein
LVQAAEGAASENAVLMRREKPTRHEGWLIDALIVLFWTAVIVTGARYLT